MREEIADLVHPVITTGLRIKERLEQGDPVDMYAEQAGLKALLQTELQAKRNADFGGDFQDDGRGGGAGGYGTVDVARARSADQFLGVRYALACWLDEIFILDSRWGPEWNERKLEEALYGSNDRAWKFWEQAQKSEARPGTDALEVFYLCVMLGFRGDYRDDPDRLKSWAKATSGAIAKGQGQEWQLPPEIEPPTNVPPLRGRNRLQKMVILAGVLVAILIPFITFLLVLSLSK